MFCFQYDNYDFSYQSVMKIARKNVINVNEFRSICVEIFKTLNNINGSFMNEIFQLSIQIVRNQNTLILIKLRENLMTFKNIKKNWDRMPFKSPICLC